MFRFDGKICNFIEREIYVACEIFFAHKFWSINPRVAIPVNLISVDRESEKVAPPRRFLDRFAPPFFSPPLPPLPLWDARISAHAFRASIIRFEAERKGDRTRTAETPWWIVFVLSLRFRRVFALQSWKNPGTSHVWDTVELFLERRIELSYWSKA